MWFWTRRSYMSGRATWIRSCRCWTSWTGSSGSSAPAPGRAAGPSGTGVRTAAPATCAPRCRWRGPISWAPESSRVSLGAREAPPLRSDGRYRREEARKEGKEGGSAHLALPCAIRPRPSKHNSPPFSLWSWQTRDLYPMSKQWQYTINT